MAGRRAADAEYAARVNEAAVLVEAGMPAAQAARVLAERFAVSQRQARRYVDQAAAVGPVPVPRASVAFTVKLPGALAERVRTRARDSGVTISALVARALVEFLHRDRRKRPGR